MRRTEDGRPDDSGGDRGGIEARWSPTWSAGVTARGPHIYGTSRSVTEKHGVSHPFTDPPPGLHLIN